MTATAKDQRPIDILREVLHELGARGLAAAGMLDEHERGLEVEFYWVGKGGPLIVQVTSDGGYDLFVPMLNSIDAEETIRVLREYAAGYHGTPQIARQLSATLLARDSARRVLEPPSAEGVSSDQPEGAAGGSERAPAAAERPNCARHGWSCGGGAVAVSVRDEEGRTAVYTVCRESAEAWGLLT